MGQIMEIKGCPFCGNQPEIQHILEGTPYEAYFVKCSNEKCECEIRHPYHSALEAMAAWDFRIDNKVSIPEDLFDSKVQNTMANIPTEKIVTLKEKITKKFGERAIWVALILLPLIDKETWKFPEHECPISLIPEIIRFLEEDKTAKELFSNGDE